MIGSPVLNHGPRRSATHRTFLYFICIVFAVFSIFLFMNPAGSHAAESIKTFSQKVKAAAQSSLANHASSNGKAAGQTHSLETVHLDEYPGLSSPLPLPDDEEYVAFCLVIKNQSIDMPEFFAHHYYHHGIRRFYVYDDGSEPPLKDKPYIKDWRIPDNAIDFTYVDPLEVKDRKNFQVDTYTDCIKRYGERHRWIAFLDPDEFLEMRGPKAPTLIDWLKQWEGNDTIGALGVHWLGHNSGGHQTQQPGDVRKAYTTCIDNDPDRSNRHIKTFVRPDRFDRIENIHWARTKDGTIEVAEHGDLVNTWMHVPISHDIWALHHYATKSREDYELKKSRNRYVYPPLIFFPGLADCVVESKAAI